MPGNKRWTEEERTLAIAMRRDGASFDEIAKAVDRTETAVKVFCATNRVVRGDRKRLPPLHRMNRYRWGTPLGRLEQELSIEQQNRVIDVAVKRQVSIAKAIGLLLG